MQKKVQEQLEQVKQVLAASKKYAHAAALVTFDQETICPPAGMEEQGEVAALLKTEAFKCLKEETHLANIAALYQNRGELEEFDRAMVEMLYRDYLKTKNITPEMRHEFALVYSKAFVDWDVARRKSDFALFAPSLQRVYEISLRQVALREEDPEATEKKVVYDHLLGDYERDMTTEVLDEIFSRCRERLVPLFKKIAASEKKIRRDFLNRPVTDEQQRKMALYLLELLDYDFERGAFTTSEHPFTSGLGKNDVRVTTHYYPTQFFSSIFSVIHECGHALFDLLQPSENYAYFIDDEKTLGMNESVSRFYENRIGRSREFIHLIYPKTCEIFPNVMEDVSEEEFYQAMNLVTPSLIRTEADEFTYTFHVMIRYEIEKALFAGEVKVEELPRLWKEKYREYLGIEPDSDRTGILQDVHWTFGFGYFPTYAIGNFYNAMYYRRLEKEMNLPQAILNGDFKSINRWMAENIFRKADRLSPREWIRDITGRELTPDDYLEYLEKKYGEIYGISV